MQCLWTAAVELRPEQVQDGGVRGREGPELHVAVALAMRERAGQEVRDGSRNDLRPPASEDTKHPRR
eukprot:15391236-Heterocapsa_arctica.AAC.1